MKRISVADIKRIREQLAVTHLVLFAVDSDGIQHVATHGESERDAKEAAKAGNNLKSALGWDDSLCKAKPLGRKCKNCSYYEADYGTFCVNGWSKRGESGFCQLEPNKVKVEEEEKCSFFEPKC